MFCILLVLEISRTFIFEKKLYYNYRHHNKIYMTDLNGQNEVEIVDANTKIYGFTVDTVGR